MRQAMRAATACVAIIVPLTSVAAHELDPTKLPLGDGKISTAAKAGYIWACHTDPNAGGAFKDGPWIDKTAGTYDLTAKAIVDGAVKWPHSFTITTEGDKRLIVWNDLPDHATGTFPIAATDDAYKYDRNPNSIQKQAMRVELPLNPTLLAKPTCAPGAVGVLLSGAVLFNALDAPGRDAVAHETQDSCQGHPQESGVYHYHNVSKCLIDADKGTGQSALMGYALDGFGIYGPRDENGNTLTSADLDECHGRTSEVEWNGARVVMYHYVATLDFPYTVGCMRGAYSMDAMMTISGGPQGGQGQGNAAEPRGAPDLNAAAAKLGIGVEALRRALGPPPPDLAATAAKLGVTTADLQSALGVP
jgi:hypothetical protein